MVTLDDFLRNYTEELAEGLSDRFSIPQQDILNAIETHFNFIPFGKFSTLTNLKKAVDNAVKRMKYCNVSTCKMHEDSVSVRKKYALYNCGVAGIPNSVELEQTLKYFPNAKLINTKQVRFNETVDIREIDSFAPLVSNASAPITNPIRTHIEVDMSAPRLILNRHSKTSVPYIGDGMFAWDLERSCVYGKMRMADGLVYPLSEQDIITLETRGFQYITPEEGTEEGKTIEICDHTYISNTNFDLNAVKGAINSLFGNVHLSSITKKQFVAYEQAETEEECNLDEDIIIAIRTNFDYLKKKFRN